MHYNFDQVIERRGTNSVKWDDTDSADVLPLWVADMDFAVAPCIQEAIVRRATHPCFGYTLVPDAYYQAIIDWFATRHQWSITKEQILYTIGVIPAIGAILKAITQTGDNILLFTPVYNHFFSLVREAGCQAIELQLVDHIRNGFFQYSIDWEELEYNLALDKTTVLLFCNPHNPLGRIWSEEEITRVLELCSKYHVTVISDEIHNEITRPGLLYTPLGRVAETFNQTASEKASYVVCSSPSKSFNLAGLQNAFIVCPDAEMRRRIDRAININEVCDVNPFGVEALIAAYNEGGEWLDEMREYVYQNYLFARDFIKRELPLYHVAELEATYLMWVNVGDSQIMLNLSIDEFCEHLIEDQKVRFSPGSIYGECGYRYLRINLACPRATLEEALKRLAAGAY